MTNPQLTAHAESYAEKHSLKLTGLLGFGTDGAVWKTSEKTAIKCIERRPNYQREVACYQRLTDCGIQEIEGFKVPQLKRFDDDLLVVEMGIVTPPYILDFGKAYVDMPPDFSAEVLEDADREARSAGETDCTLLSQLFGN